MQFVETTISDWTQVKELTKQMVLWVFRGQPDARWPLSTNIERIAKQNSYLGSLKNREYVILNDFKRRAHHFVQSPPDSAESSEWLALLQHHGGPTRLLDFTYSIYIATYFALENAATDAAIWCVHNDLCSNQLYKIVDIKPGKGDLLSDLMNQRNTCSPSAKMGHLVDIR